MTSICQELPESDVKIVLVNNSTTPVLLSLITFWRDSKMFVEPTFDILVAQQIWFFNDASTGTRDSLLRYCRISSCPNEKLHAMFHKSTVLSTFANMSLYLFFWLILRLIESRGSFVIFCNGWFCLSVKRFLCCIKYFKYLYWIHYVSVWYFKCTWLLSGLIFAHHIICAQTTTFY